MELFSEIYGRYFTAVAKLLRRAHTTGLTRGELEKIIAESAFSESGLHLLPKLLGGEWDLLREREGLYYSKLEHADTGLPLTALQKSWLRALLDDPRARLFWDDGEIRRLRERFMDTPPLFDIRDFHVFDTAGDGDDYSDPAYIRRFRLVLGAVRGRRRLQIVYRRGNGRAVNLLYSPEKLLYSPKDNKFRAAGRQFAGGGSKAVLLNLARMDSVSLAEQESASPSSAGHDRAAPAKRAVSLAISGERNALERCMLQFAAYDKRTEWDDEREQHVCTLSYDPLEETEVLIRVLSFGPVVEVLGPEEFLRRIRDRVHRQSLLLL